MIYNYKKAGTQSVSVFLLANLNKGLYSICGMQVSRSQGVQPVFGLIDGNRLPKDWDLPCECIIGGDGKSLSIAAASIVAKVTRNHILADLAKEYPQYGWAKNAGYGTAEHIAALKEYGVTPHHRKSYKPVAELLNSAK